MDDQALSDEVRSRFDEWINCINTRDFRWMEENLRDDFTVSAHPFPQFLTDKAGFIEADKQIEEADIELLDVRARQVGGIILSQTVAKIGKEKISGRLGEGMPTGEEISEMLTGKTVVYVSAWERIGGRLICFDHHMVGPID